MSSSAIVEGNDFSIIIPFVIDMYVYVCIAWILMGKET